MSKDLDLTLAPSTLFIFGLSGAGKSYVGDLIRELAGWHTYHADDALINEISIRGTTVFHGQNEG